MSNNDSQEAGPIPSQAVFAQPRRSRPMFWGIFGLLFVALAATYWRRTRATHPAVVVAPPAPDSVHVTHDPALRFQMTRSGDEFFQTAILKTPRGEERKKSRIDLVYGAGAGTDEVYLTWRGDLLYELPIAWLHPEHAWGASAI